MKVLYDSQMFDAQIYGGITNYFTEIIKQGCDNHLFEPILPFFFTSNRHLKEASIDSKLIFYNSEKWNFKGKYRLVELLKFLNEQTQKYEMNHSEYDVFHPTYYESPSAKINKPMVVTVHDLIYELFPHLFRNSKQVIDMKKKLIDQASLLIAVSECTKRDLINVYNVSENKIKVIYHAASLSHLTTKNKIASPFILFVGQRAAYKNFDVLTVAFSKVLKKHNVNLICVGGGAFTQGELHKFEALKIENYSIQKSATKEELAGLYSQAICLVYPSLYEGFGIPILEAFSLECPVVCSDIAIFREIAGTAALYFDPNSSKSISDALSNVIENDDLTIQLRKYGALQNEKYSWQRAAELTRDAYLEVAQP